MIDKRGLVSLFSHAHQLKNRVVSGGPMLNGRFRGEELGSGTDVFRLDEEYRTGKISKADLKKQVG